MDALCYHRLCNSVDIIHVSVNIEYWVHVGIVRCVLPVEFLQKVWSDAATAICVMYTSQDPVGRVLRVHLRPFLLNYLRTHGRPLPCVSSRLPSWASAQRRDMQDSGNRIASSRGVEAFTMQNISPQSDTDCLAMVILNASSQLHCMMIAFAGLQQPTRSHSEACGASQTVDLVSLVFPDLVIH